MATIFKRQSGGVDRETRPKTVHCDKAEGTGSTADPTELGCRPNASSGDLHRDERTCNKYHLE
jgi:hypothetical protein